MRTSEIRRLRRTMRRFDRLTGRQIKRCCRNVTVAQCHLLLEIETQTETTTQLLARELQLDKSTVSLTVDGLVKKGMVSRAPDASDRRVTRLRLTRRGQTTCHTLNRVNDEYIARVLERIPRGRRRIVIDQFAVLVEAIARHEENEA